MDVCESFEKGKISFEAPKHEVGKKHKIIKPMSIIWWRPLRFNLDRIAQLICQKLLDGQCFFGKKSKVASLEEHVNHVVKAEAAYEAIKFLLQVDKDLAGVEYRVDQKKVRGLGKIIDNVWAMKWLKIRDSDSAPTKDVCAKIPSCIEMIYEEIKIDALRGKMQIMFHC